MGGRGYVYEVRFRGTKDEPWGEPERVSTSQGVHNWVSEKLTPLGFTIGIGKINAQVHQTRTDGIPVVQDLYQIKYVEPLKKPVSIILSKKLLEEDDPEKRKEYDRAFGASGWKTNNGGA